MKRKLFKKASFACIMSLGAGYSAHSSILLTASLGKVATVAASSLAAYYWFTPDRSYPTLEQLNLVTLLPIECNDPSVPETPKAMVLKILKNKKGTIMVKGNCYQVCAGIPESIKNQTSPVFIYSGGYSNNGNPYSYCAYTALKSGLIQGPCVTFDYATDTRRAFNFCQSQDLRCVELAYENLLKQAPNARIILHGACKGAMNSLRFLAEYDEKSLANIKAVIAESPVISVKKALAHWKNGGILSHLLCRFSLPNYTPRLKTIMEATKFPNIPVFVGSLPHDTLSGLDDIKNMCKHLRTLHPSKDAIRHHISNRTDVWHGEIGKAEDYRDEVQDFLFQHGLSNKK